MKNSMTDLRNHLFEVMEALKDKEHPMDLDRARAVCQTAQVLVNSAKVEVDFLEAVDASLATGFFDAKRPAVGQLPDPRDRRSAN